MTMEINSFLKNRYRIEQIIAKGGMGAIYAAFDESLSVRVALKENLFTSDDSTRQFRREATILASLKHSTLPRVTDHFVIPDQGQYLVMDYIEGEDLKDRIKRAVSLSEEEVALIGIAICEALAYMHSRKPSIVHRDIKPGNIKITPNGEVYLVDFGIAKISQPGQGTTVGAQSLTPGFAPPEQYGQGTDPRTDIYSLGATLYMALTGVVPPNGLARLMKQELLKPIKEIKPQVSKALASAIEKALAVKKEERYQTAQEFLNDLLSAHQGARTKKDTFGAIRLDPAPTVSGSRAMKSAQRITADPKGATLPLIPTGKPKRKVPIWLIIGIIAVFLCVAAVGISFATGIIPGFEVAQKATNTATPTLTEPSATNPPVATNTPTNEPSTQTPTNTQAVQDTYTPSPSATEEVTPTPETTAIGGGAGQIAFVSDRSGTPQIYLIFSDGTGLQQITNELDGACQPDWSPDGQRLVYVSPCRIENIINPSTETYRGSTLFIINADGTSRIPLQSFPGGDFDPSWSPDGIKIAFATYRDNLTSTDLNIYTYNLEDNSVTKITGDLNNDRRPAWSPDGQEIGFQRQPQGGSIQINVMTADGSSIYIFSDQGLTNSFMPDWSVNDTIVFSRGNPFPLPITRPLTPRNAQEIQLSDDPAWDIDFSPDGYWLAFERVVFISGAERNHDIFISSSLGGFAEQLTTDPARDYHPAWRPFP